MQRTGHRIKPWGSATGGRMLRLLLLLSVTASLWQAPVPWWHRHRTVQVTDTADCLLRHVKTWHASHSSSAEETDDWHLHFATLDEILRGCGCPIPVEDDHRGGPRTAQSVSTPDCCSGRPDVPRDTTCAVAVVPDTVGGCLLLRSEDIAKRQFLNDHAERHRLLTVLCVALC